MKGDISKLNNRIDNNHKKVIKNFITNSDDDDTFRKSDLIFINFNYTA